MYHFAFLSTCFNHSLTSGLVQLHISSEPTNPPPTPTPLSTTTIEGQVFLDLLDQDGELDTGEPCYRGDYTIKLDDLPPNDLSGCGYLIPNVSSGWHDVELEPPAGYSVTGWNQGHGQMGHMGNKAHIRVGSPDIVNFGISSEPTSTPYPTSPPKPTPTPTPPGYHPFCPI